MGLKSFTSKDIFFLRPPSSSFPLPPSLTAMGAPTISPLQLGKGKKWASLSHISYII